MNAAQIKKTLKEIKVGLKSGATVILLNKADVAKKRRVAKVGKAKKARKPSIAKAKRVAAERTKTAKKFKGGYRRDMSCRHEGCSEISKGPRYHFMCEKHLGMQAKVEKPKRLTKAEKRAAKKAAKEAAKVAAASLPRDAEGMPTRTVNVEPAPVVVEAAPAPVKLALAPAEPVEEPHPHTPPEEYVPPAEPPKSATDVVGKSIGWG
jgi:hypothetical protein